MAASISPNIRSTTLTLRDRLSAQIFHLTRFRPLVGAEGLEPTETRFWIWRVCQFRHTPIFVKMDKLYLHFTQCFSLTYLQQHRIGCFLTLLSTTLFAVTLPPLTRFIINPHLSLDRVLVRDTPNHVSSILWTSFHWYNIQNLDRFLTIGKNSKNNSNHIASWIDNVITLPLLYVTSPPTTSSS